MMCVTGLLVTDFTLSRMTGPQSGYLVSTSTTPLAVMNTAVLPPPPAAPGTAPPPPFGVMMKRLSRTFSMSAAFGSAGAGCCARRPTASAPAITMPPRTTIRLMSRLQEKHAPHEPVQSRENNPKRTRDPPDLVLQLRQHVAGPLQTRFDVLAVDALGFRIGLPAAAAALRRLAALRRAGWCARRRLTRSAPPTATAAPSLSRGRQLARHAAIAEREEARELPRRGRL